MTVLLAGLVQENDAGAHVTYFNYVGGGITLDSFNVTDNRFEIVQQGILWKIQLIDGASLDYESHDGSFELTFHITDDEGNVSTEKVKIAITDVNEAPVFMQDSYSITISEDITVGSAIKTLVAQDVDADDPLTYSIIGGEGGGNDSGLFAINEDGEITLTGALDYETATTHTLSVQVEDSAGLTDTATVTINVENVTEAPTFAQETYTATIARGAEAGDIITNIAATDANVAPVFSQDSYTATHAENTLAGSTLLTFSVNDADADVDGWVNVSIIGGNDDGLLRVRSIGGEGRYWNLVLEGTLDYETATSHTFTLRARDDKGGVGIAEFTLIVTDVNESATSDGNSYHVDVASSAKIGDLVIDISETDAEDATYAIVSGNNDLKFGIDTAGRILLTEPRVRLTPDTHTLTVEVTDSDGNIDTKFVTINDAAIRLKDLGHGYHFSPSSYTHPDNGDAVIHAGIGDDKLRLYNGGDDTIYGGDGDDVIYDYGGDDTLYGEGGYDILYGSEGDDTLYGGVGDDVLYGGTGRDLIYGGAGGDQFKFSVDRTKNTDADADVIVDFNIADGDRIQLLNIVAESTFRVSSLDELLDIAGFRIDTSGDKIISGLESGENDAEADDTVLYRIVGVADDAAGRPDNDADDIVVAVLEDVTGITFDMFDVSIVGNGGDNTLYGTSGNDALVGGRGDDVLDGGGGVNVFYGGLGSDTFVLNMDGSGVDTVDIFAPGDGGFGGDTIRVDIDEMTTSALDTLFSTDFRIAREDVSIEGLYRPYDNPTKDTTIYKVVGKADAAANGESDDVLVMVLQDYTGPITYKMFGLDVGGELALPAPNQAPVFSQDFYRENVAETTAVGSVVASVVATDADANAGDALTYSITGGNDSGLFTINGDGEITLTSALNRDVATSYTLSVQARDGAEDIGTAEVVINITDGTPHQTPVFAQDSYSANLAANVAVDSVVTTLTAQDADTGDTLRYAIIGGEGAELFAIDAATGRVTVADGDVRFERTAYNLTIEATDSYGSADTTELVVKNPAAFLTDHTSDGRYYTKHGSDDIEVIYNDYDVPSAAAYGYGGNDLIRIYQTGGVAYGGSGDDFIDGHQNGYDDIFYGGSGNDLLGGDWGDDILYGDSGNDHLSGGRGDDTLYGGSGNDYLYGDRGADIFVLNANDDGVDTVSDFAPRVEGDRIRIEINTAPVTETVDGLFAVANLRWEQGDIASGIMKYGTIETPSYSHVGLVDFNYEHRDHKNLANTAIYRVVGAADTAENGENNDVLVMVLEDFISGLTYDMFDVVIDATAPTIPTNQAPTFAQDSYSVSIARGAEAGDIITNIAATDADGDTLTYSITNGNDSGKFIVDATNGDIKLAVPNQRTGAGDHTLTLTATDTAGNSDTATVTITDYAIRGTDAQDALHGTTDGDTIYGYGGSDTITGGDGSDVLWGGSGVDIIYGGGATDVLSGGEGDDIIYGGDGDDVIYGNEGDDTIYGGAGRDLIKGQGGADSFVLNTDATSSADMDVIGGFSVASGDKIRVESFNGVMPKTIEAFLAAANLRAETGEFDNFGTNNTIIYKVVGGDNGESDDIALMALVYFSEDLTLDMFDLPNATANQAPTFAQDSYSATIAQGAEVDDITEVGDIITNIAATDADSDTLIYAITAGNDAGLFIVDATNGDIKLATPETPTDATDHTITITATDTAGNTDTATVTITDYAIRGTDGEDSMTGSDETDFIYGYGGDDILNGGAGGDWIDGYDGDDMLYGGDDADAVWGGGGADTLYGGAGDDWLFGEGGDDRLYGGDGGDVLYGNEGDDRLSGDAGGDWLYGQDGDDRLYGNDGDDWLYGQDGDDTLSGGAGDDTLRGDSGGDDLHGGDGDDVLYGSGGDDTLYGDAGDDTLHGGSASDVLYGDAGADTLNGSYGGDVIYGGVDNDILNGDDGDDLLEGSAGTDTLYGGAGSDYLRGDSLALIGTEIFTGPADADIFVLNTADSGTDTITDFTPSDGDKIRIEEFTGVIPRGIEAFLTAANLRVEKGHIKVDAWANINIPTDDNAITNTAIYSGDRLVMVLEDFTDDLTLDMFDLPNAITNTAPTFAQDSYSASIARGAEIGDIITNIAATDADSDTLTYSITAGNDAGLFIVDATNGDIKLAVPDKPTDATDHTITITATDTTDNADTATVTITDYAIRGTDVQDVFHGTIDGDTIYGYGGHDYLNGGDGDDTIYGGDGIDRLRGNDGDDTLYGGSGSNSLTGGDGDDTLYGGSDRDSLSGGYGNDVLYGGSGNDKLFDLRGIDLLHGGLGADLFKMSFFFDTPDDVTNIVVDFNAEEGDIIGLHGIRVSGTFQPSSVEELAAAAGLRFDTSGSKVIKGHESGENDADINDTVIYKGDTAIAVIEDFTGLTLDMIELGVAGSDDDNIIHGGDNDDTIDGNGGNDTLYGGDGHDKLYGNAGDDTIYGGDGKDAIFGSAGDDIIHGGDGNDSLIGGVGADTIYGGAGIVDHIYGNDGDDILYGGDGDDFLNGQGGADIFALNADDTGADLVRDFIPSDGDKIRVDAFTGAIPESVEALLAATNLRVEKGHITLPNPRADSHSDSKTTENTAIYSGDRLVMVLEDFEDDLTLDMFDLPNATPNSAPVFAQDSYSASIARGAEAGDIITNIAATDADDDTLTYTITAGNDAGLFIVDATNGDIKLAVPNQRTNPGDHTLTLTATDTAGNTDTATVTITDYAIRGTDVQDVLFGTADGNAIYGYDGDDTLHGGQNDNILYGGEGDDTLHGGQNDDILYGGEGDDTLWGYQGADIFVLNTDDSGFDVVRDFNAVGGDFNGSEGDKIRMTEFVSVMPTTIESFLTAANLRVVKGHIGADGDSATAIFRGDKLVMVLEYFTKDLTLDMFDLPNATINTAPVFTQDSYTADSYRVEGWTVRLDASGTAVVVSATDADGDAVTYAITAGNDAGFFDIGATNGTISFGAPDVQIHAATHTLTVTATDTAGNTDTATVTITDGAMRGTDNEETLTGSDDSDRIYGYDGDDTLYGGDGDDHIWGNAGDDTLYGGAGDDWLGGGDGDDTLYGVTGNNGLYGHGGDDTLYAGDGGDGLSGGDGDDTLYGSAGGDHLNGGAGDDWLEGGAGKDYLHGGGGADIFMLGSGEDRLGDFTPSDGDKIRVTDFTGTIPGSVEAFLTAANLRVEKGHIKVEGFNSGRDSTATENTAIYRGDTLLMVLEDFTTDLTLDMFDLPNATINTAPTFAQDSYSATLAETAEAGSAVVTVQATDANAGDTLTYSIVSNNIPGLFVEDTIIDNAPPFAIDAQSGAITLTGALDYNTATTHTITIQVEDSAGLTDTATITINVTDSAIRGTDDADRIGGTADADTIYGYGGDDFIYAQFGDDTLYGGTGDDVLHGSGGSDTLYGGAGDDTLDGGAGLDTLYGGAGDDKFALDIHGLLQGHITDDSHADTLKDFGNGNDKIHIHVPASVLPSLDVAISSLEQLYSIFNLRVEKGHIAVDALNGNIDDTAIENTAIYSGDVLLMVLEDFTADLTLNMFAMSHGIINRAPEFAQETYTATLAETAETGSAVVTVAASDADIDDTLTYSIIGGDGGGDGLFAINDDGEITLTGALDYETATSHNLTIKAQDKNGDTDTAKVVVRVTDANDNAPIFDAATHRVEIPELTEIGTTLTTVTARDADTSGVRYSILGGRNANLFSINENTGAITLKGFLDFETAESHRLVVQASDGVSTDTINVIIGVVDEMDCACLDIAANTDEIAAGTVLTASITHDDPNGYEGGKAPESGWVWFYQSNPDQEIGDGSSTYTVREEDSGEQICVRITYMDGNGRPEIVQARLEDVVQRVVIKPDAEDADKDQTYTAEADKATKVEAGTGADHVRDGNRNDVIDGGKGDDEIDLSASKEDNDVVIYGIGNQMASDGADSITSFVRGRDKFVFQLKQSDIDAGDIDLSADDGYEGFINYVTKGTEDLIDDQFWVNFNFSIGENGVQMDGISFHFKDSTFFSGGRISMPIVSIEFADPLSVDEVREVYSGRDKSTPLVKQGLLSDFDYLDDFLGGDGAVGFDII